MTWTMKNVTFYLVIASGQLASVLLTCTEGEFLEKGTCKKCPEKCLTCLSKNFCTVCKNGYWNQTCNDKCTGCIPHSPCDIERGICTQACADGLSGARCDKKCDIKCANCYRFEESKCEKCASERYGINCELFCPKTCKIQTCDDDGLCSDGCIEGYWGSRCNCLTRCKDNICNKNDGKCSKGCTGNYQGFKCLCPAGCTCDDDGTCINCDNNSSITCDERCSDGCFGTLCYAKTAECVNGCTDGYEGIQCRKDSDTNSADIDFVWLYFLLGILVAVFVCIFVYKRYRTRRNVRTGGVQTYNGLRTNALGMYIHFETDGRAKPQVTASRTVHNHCYFKTENPIQGWGNGFTIHNQETGVCVCTQHSETSLEELHEKNMQMEINAVKTALEAIYDCMKPLTSATVSLVEFERYILRTTLLDIQKEFQDLPSDLVKPITIALTKENFLKNRYRGIYPYDENRVAFKDQTSRYINASYIEGHCQEKAFIACLGPNRKYMGEMSLFWEVVWQENCYIIVMLANLNEEEAHRCDQYWPNKGNTETCGNIGITSVSEIASEDGSTIERTIQLEKKQEQRLVKQLQFTDWSERSVPRDANTLVEFWKVVNKLRRDGEGPLLVHCSSGVGRTGTFIALDILKKEADATGSINIPACVCRLREQRVHMVQTLDQYIFLHKVLLLTLKEQIIRGSNC